MSHPDYVPIACGLHDQLQLLVMRGRPVPLVVQDNGGHTRTLEARLVDVLTRDGAEWVVTEDGAEIRLDRLVEVDGHPFAAGC